jgi:hypothetical protein
MSVKEEMDLDFERIVASDEGSKSHFGLRVRLAREG